MNKHTVGNIHFSHICTYLPDQELNTKWDFLSYSFDCAPLLKTYLSDGRRSGYFELQNFIYPGLIRTMDVGHQVAPRYL